MHSLISDRNSESSKVVAKSANKLGAVRRSSPDKRFDESHVSSDDDQYGDRSIRDSQAMPIFDNLPSVRSKITEEKDSS